MLLPVNRNKNWSVSIEKIDRLKKYMIYQKISAKQSKIFNAIIFILINPFFKFLLNQFLPYFFLQGVHLRYLHPLSRFVLELLKRNFRTFNKPKKKCLYSYSSKYMRGRKQQVSNETALLAIFVTHNSTRVPI